MTLQTAPPVASDLATCFAVESWLNNQGWAWSYGPWSVRIERRDNVLFGGNGNDNNNANANESTSRREFSQ